MSPLWASIIPGGSLRLPFSDKVSPVLRRRVAHSASTFSALWQLQLAVSVSVRREPMLPLATLGWRDGVFR